MICRCAVTGRLDSEPQPGRACVSDHGNDVTGAPGQRDRRWLLVDREVPRASRVVPHGIAGVLRFSTPAADADRLLGRP